MAQNKLVRFGPVALMTTMTTNILNPTVTSLSGPVGFTLSQPYFILRHIRIINKTGTTATFSLWVGATGANAAGTEVVGSGWPISANSAFDLPCALRLDAADFLVGGAGTTLSLVFEAEGEVGFS